MTAEVLLGDMIMRHSSSDVEICRRDDGSIEIYDYALREASGNRHAGLVFVALAGEWKWANIKVEPTNA